MEHFLASLPDTIMGWTGIIALGVFGVFAVIGMFDKRSSERKKEMDGSEDRLIDILQKTVIELETKVNKQTADIAMLTKKVDELKRDNEKYIEIFQGRDTETKEFYKRAYVAMDTVTSTHDIMTTMAESIKNTNQAMQRLIDLLGKSVDVVGQAVKK